MSLVVGGVRVLSSLTERLQDILPELPQKYPNMEMQAEIVTTSPPTASFSPQGIQVAGPGQIIVSVLPASGSPVNVFAFNIQLSTSAKVRHDARHTPISGLLTSFYITRLLSRTAGSTLI